MDFGTPGCTVGNISGRKIAHKGGFAYEITGDPRDAEIDAVIAHEQFNELAPVTVEAVAEFIRFYAPLITVATDPNSTGTGTITSSPGTIDCGTTCSALFVRTPTNDGAQVQLTATPDNGSTFTGWRGDCSGTDNPITLDVTADKKCTATFSQVLAVDLNPFGSTTDAGPYSVQVVDGNLNLTAAPADITVTLLRQVISACSGLLFSSNRTVVIPQGQGSATYNFDAGRDPACNTQPIKTQYTVTQVTMNGQPLGLGFVPPAQLFLSVTR
jgi:hypothetical protein